MPGAATAQLLKYSEIVDVDMDQTNDVNFADTEDYGHRVVVDVNTTALNNYLQWQRLAGSARPTAKLNDIYEAGFKMALGASLAAGYVDIDGVSSGLHFGSTNLSTNADSRVRKGGRISANDIALCFVLYKLYGSSATQTLDHIYNLADAHDMISNATLTTAITESFKTNEAGAVDMMFRDLLASDPHRFFNSQGVPAAGLFETNADAAGSGTWKLTENDTLEVKLKFIFQSKVTRRGVAGREHNLTATDPATPQENQQTIISPGDYFYIRLQLKANPSAPAGGTAGEVLSNVIDSAIENLGTSVSSSELKAFLGGFTASNPAPTSTVSVTGIPITSLAGAAAGSFDTSVNYDVNFVLLTDNQAVIDTTGLGENTVLYIPSTIGTPVTLIVDSINYSLTTTSNTVTINSTTYTLGQKITVGNKTFLFAFGGLGLVVRNASPGIAKMATRIGGAASYRGVRVGADNQGNVYLHFETPSGTGTAHYIYNYSSAPVSGGEIPTSLYATISGGEQYLVKYNSSGQAQWATIIPRSYVAWDLTPCSTPVCDSNGNIYIVGASFGNRTLYNYSSTSGGVVSTSAYGTINLVDGGKSCFIIKYNPAGSVVWATRVGSSSGSASSHAFFPTVSVDSNDNIAVCTNIGYAANHPIGFYSYTGKTGGAVTMSNYGTISTSSTASTYDTVIAKYNSAGVVQWATCCFNTGSEEHSQSAAVFDSAGNLYVAVAKMIAAGSSAINSFTSAPASVGGNILLTQVGTLAHPNKGVMIVKYNASGAVQYANRVVANVGTHSPCLSVDGSNNLYLTHCWSWINGVAQLSVHSYSSTSGGTINTTAYGILSSSGEFTQACALIKYNSAGAVQWATKQDLPNASNVPFNSVVDSNGNTYIAMGYDNFGGANGIKLYSYSGAPSGAGAVGITLYGTVPSAGVQDFFIAKYNTAGAVAWATNVGGAGVEGVGAIALMDDHVVVAGMYNSNPVAVRSFLAHPTAQGTVYMETFGTLPDVNLSAGQNMFLVKYGI